MPICSFVCHENELFRAFKTSLSVSAEEFSFAQKCGRDDVQEKKRQNENNREGWMGIFVYFVESVILGVR